MTLPHSRCHRGTRCPWIAAVLASFALAIVCSRAQADDRSLCGPEYAQDGQLILPSNYREWYHASTSLGLTYGPAAPPPDAPQLFDTVYVSWAAYHAFVQTGTWPDGTMFILELRQSYTPEAVQVGSLVPGDIVAIEAEVKDLGRFGGNGWRFFSFSGPQGTIADTAAPIESNASCYACHAANTAVDNTFVQFYPPLMEIAEQFGTIRPDWDPTRAF